MNKQHTVKVKASVLCIILLFSTIYSFAQTPFSGTRTIGSSGTYATITAAMADASFNGINGPLILELLPSYASGGETFPITIPTITGASATNAITLRPQAGASGLTISSAHATTTIDLNGTQYVTIDGRPGGTGSFTASVNLTVTNTLGTAPAVRLINDARYNNIKYCDLQSNNNTIFTATSGAGVVCFGTTTGTNGNDYNTISYCDIHNITGGNPVVGVFSYGTITSATHNNDFDTISNCNIYNFFHATLATSGVNLGTGTNGWSIIDNRFFQTASLAYNAAVTHRVINILTGNAYNITGNYIGGNSSTGSGYYTIAGTTSPTTSAHSFIAIEVTAGTTAYSNILNNTISNIDFTTAAAGSLTMGGINVLGGNVNCNFNTIGSPTINGAIKLTSNCATNVAGIICLRSGTSVSNINFNNNTISGIDLYGNATTFTPEFHGINITQTSTTVTANNNVIGSLTLPNSINLISTCATSIYGQRLSGFIINNTSAATVTVNNNIIANCNTNYAATGTHAASVRGIYITPTSTGTYTVTNNIITNLTSASQTTGSGINSTLIGIGISTTTAACIVTGNTLSSLMLTGSSTTAAVQNTGIFYAGMTTGTNSIAKNIIRNLSLSASNPTAFITGMDIASGLLTVSNNMIALGYDSTGSPIMAPCTIRGITKNTAVASIYFNSIYIGGNNVGSNLTNTFAFARTAAAADIIRNNIFVNNRSNASAGGKHYQCFLINTNTLTLNNNVYFGNGAGAIFGTLNNGTSDIPTFIQGWVAGDNQSVSGDPQFMNPTGGSAFVNLHIQPTVATVVESGGVTIAGITDDIDGQTRSTLTPEDIGADAGNFIQNDVLPPAITLVGSPLSNTALFTDRTLSATITDFTGTYTTGALVPRVYFRKATGSFVSSAGTLVSGNGKTGTWSFTIGAALVGGIAPGDSIYYFITAQDSLVAPNISSLPLGAQGSSVVSISVTPTDAYGYKISQLISGTKNIGPSGNYTSITQAISDIVSNVVGGSLTLELLPGYLSTAEPAFPITIPSIQNLSETNTITIRPQSGATGLIITSAAAVTIDMNGAKYITIDGRPGGTGTKDLTISNTSTTGVAIRFINDACFNKIVYDSIKGVNSAAAGGVILFSTTTGTRGNDSNTVDNCDIKDGATTPATIIYSTGTTTTTAHFNSHNAITNNNIYNFWSATTENNAFKISSGSTDWIMSGNSIYQTSPRVATAALQQYIWNNNASTANNHVMSNNYIGGSAPLCGGTAWTVTSTTGYRFTGAYLNGGAGGPFTYSENTFANINITTGTTAYATIPGVFNGVWLVGGFTNVTNNTFGSMSTNNSIVVTSSVTNNLIVPIGATGTPAGVINIKNNNIGGITTIGSTASIGSNIYGIGITTSTATTTYNIDSNTIGNTLADNIIASNSANAIQTVAGIYSTATANQNIRGNRVQNMRNNFVGTTTSVSWIHGMNLGGNAIDTLIGNTISNLVSTAAYQSNNSGSAAIIGIRLVTTTAGNFVNQNKVYGLSLTNTTSTASVTAIGILCNSLINSTVSRNTIHSLTTAGTGTTAGLNGILMGGGSPRLINNTIRLGIDTNGNALTTTPLIYGIFKTAGSLISLFNTVYIGGAGAGTGVANTFALNSTATGVDSVFNNIFVNERSNSSTGGSHYAIGLTSNTTLQCNGNVYWSTGNLGLFGATPHTAMSTWTNATSVDASSTFANPQLINPTGSTSSYDLHISPSIATPVESSGVPIASVTDDMDGQTRSSFTPTDIGADGGNFLLSDMIPPAVSGFTLASTPLTTDRTFTVNISDGTGLAVTGTFLPRVYFKKFTAGTFNSASGTLVSGTPKNGTWSFTIQTVSLGGLTMGDSVYYYIVAQDSSTAANFGSYPAGAVGSNVLSIISAPNTLLNYTILPSFNGTITVGSGGTYPSLTTAGGAFAAINSGALTGDVTLSIISDLTEDGTNGLNQWIESGTGNYKLTIAPNTTTLRSIAGSVAANGGLITLNGADRVIIDGRSGGSGMYLSIRNRSTGGCTIKLLNDAHRDTIQYCFIEGLSNTSPGATIWFTTPATNGTGNDSNAILNNHIKDTLNNTTAGSVQNTSFHSNGNNNSENTISNNHFFNYLYQGINIASGLTNHDNWVFSNNSFYQGDNARTKTTSSATQAFLIQSGNNLTITNNSIGGSAPDRSGIPFKATWNTTLNLTMKMMELTLGTTTTSTISGNTIGNIQSNPAGSVTAAFSGIHVTAGSINITNNTIGGGTNVYDTIMEGSYNGAGINIQGGTIVNVTNNTIGNIYNNSSYTTAATRTLGIFVAAGTTVNLTNNTIRDIRSITPAFGTAPAYAGSSPAGIFVNAAAATIMNIEGNTIYNMVNTSIATTASVANGITISGGTCTVQRNRMYNIYGTSAGTGTASPYAIGLFATTSGHTFKHNQVLVGANTTGETQVFGIRDIIASGTNNYVYNSVYVDGIIAGGTNNSYAFQRTSTGTHNIVNNILFNNRTTLGIGTNYAIGSSNAAGMTNAHNLLVVGDTAKLVEMPAATTLGIGAFNNTFTNTYNTNWMESSVNLAPSTLFVDATTGNLGIITTNAACWYANGKGLALAGTTGDFANAATTRSTTITAGATDIGSVEFNTSTLPPNSTVSSAPALNSTTNYSFANRKVAAISWAATGTLPTSVAVKYYSGVNAPNLLANKTQFNGYVNVTATGTPTAAYGISIISDSAILGNVSGTAGTRLAYYSGSVWNTTASAANANTGLVSTTGVLTAATLNANFTGTDIANPLPVQLLTFTAKAANKDVVLNWWTATERNNKGFEIEHSADGKTFETIGFVEGTNDANVSAYRYTDGEAFAISNTLYYRLKQVDFDGTVSYSKIVSVSVNNEVTASIYPIPAADQLTISSNAGNLQNCRVSIVDLLGRVVLESSINTAAASHTLSVNSLHTGAYILIITTEKDTQRLKFIKE
ncbi:MAG: T9SS type A sorting domain-containing protein [Bacteroidota bacterium]